MQNAYMDHIVVKLRQFAESRYFSDNRN